MELKHDKNEQMMQEKCRIRSGSLKPKISVIVPVYKVEEYLDRCLNSIVSQSFTDFEVILVDDGSPDHCPQMCDEWAQKDKRIKVIHKENDGLSNARNDALDIAKGEYICFIDSDDWIEPGALKIINDRMEAGYDLLAFQFQFVYEDGLVKPGAGRLAGNFCFDSEKKKISFVANILLQGKIGWEACFHVYKRDIIEKGKLRFVDNRKIFAEDMLFTACYSFLSDRALSIKNTLYNYYQHSGSIMDTQKKQLNAGRMSRLGKEADRFLHVLNYSKAIWAYPFMYYLMMDNVISRYQEFYHKSITQLRKDIIADLDDCNYFQKQMKSLKRCKKIIFNAYGRSRLIVCKTILTSQYYSTGNYGYVILLKMYDVFVALIEHLVNCKRKE